jgi:hypothetical protein
MASGTDVRRRLCSSPFSTEELASFRSLLDHQGHGILESCQGLVTPTLAGRPGDPDPSTDYLGQALDELREISEALAKIDTRRYGRCEECGDAIPADRLLVVPATRTCDDCTWKTAESR